jgi:hypothetical protein
MAEEKITTLEGKLNNPRKYKEGLGFTIDLKRAFEKTIESRYKEDSDQDLVELLRMGLENSESYVKIKDTPEIFSVEFDGDGVSSGDDLVKLMLSIYGGKSLKGSQKFQRLGAALGASLAKKPLEIIVETHNKGEGIRMLVPPDLKPQIYKPDHEVKTNKVIIKRGKLARKKLKKPLFRRTDPFELRKEKVRNMSKYVTNIISYNGKKYNKGLNFNDAIIQAEYTINDTKIVLAISEKENLSDKTITFLNNQVYLDSKHLSEYCSPESIGISNTSQFNQKVLTPSILVDSPNISCYTSGDIIENMEFSKLQDDVAQAVSRFHNDFLTGQIHPLDKKMSKKEKAHLDQFLLALFYSNMNSENIKTDFIKKYVHHKKDLYSTLPTNDQLKIDKFFNIKLFKDIEGNRLTIPETYSLLEKAEGNLYFTKKKETYRYHPAIKEEIKGKDVLLIDGSTQMTLFQKLFYSSTLFKAPEFDEINLKCVDSIIRDYELVKKKEHNQKVDKVVTATGKVAKGGTITAATGGISFGGYQFVQHCGPWVAGAVAKTGSFLFVTHPEIIGGVCGTFLAGYGLVKGAPYAWRGTKYITKKTGHGIASGSIALSNQVRPPIISLCSIVSGAYKNSKAGVKHVNSSLKDKTQFIDDAISGTTDNILEYTVRKPSRFTWGITKRSSGAVYDGLCNVFDSLDQRREKKKAYKKQKEIEKKFRKKEKLEKKKYKKMQRHMKLDSLKQERHDIEIEKRNQRRLAEIKQKELDNQMYCTKFGANLSKRSEAYLDKFINYLYQLRMSDENYGNLTALKSVVIKKREKGVLLSSTKNEEAFNFGKKDDRNTLYINTYSAKFNKILDDFYNTNGFSLFSDLEEINGSYLNSFVSSQVKDKFKQETIDILYGVELENIFSMYCLNDEGFKTSFPLLNADEKSAILKRVLEDDSNLFNDNQSQEDINNENWLIEQYGSLIEEISEKMMCSNKTFEQIMNSSDGWTEKRSIRLFESLSPKEKLSFAQESGFENYGVEVLKKHIFANHPFISTIGANNTPNSTIDKVISAYYEGDQNEFNKLFEKCYTRAFTDQINKRILSQTLFNNDTKTESQLDIDDKILEDAKSCVYLQESIDDVKSFIEGSDGFVVSYLPHEEHFSFDRRPPVLTPALVPIEGLMDKHILHTAKNTMASYLDRFHNLPNSERGQFISLVRNKQSKNPYYSQFIKAIKQYYPQNANSTGPSEIIV